MVFKHISKVTRPQTSVSQAQGPGSKGEEWGYIQLSVWSHQVQRGIYRGNLKDPGGMLQRTSQRAFPYTCAQPAHWSSAQPRPIQHNREGGPGPVQVDQGAYLH